MHLKLICCKIVEREIANLSCTCKNVIDVTMLRQKLHDRPQELNKILQDEIHQIDEGIQRYSNVQADDGYDAILLGYGLCSGAVTGLYSRKYPIVIPKAHDCVTFLMGDKDRYMDYYMQNTGTFYYWPGAVELMDFQEDDRYERRYRYYLMRYKGNERKARKAVAVEKSFLDTYKKVTYIGWPSLPFPEYERKIQEYARIREWEFEKLEGRNTLLRKMLDGEWDEESFLVLQPGETVEPGYDKDILRKVEAIQEMPDRNSD